ncbi:MAG: hypothetical protein AVO33_03525 [delta proteobacterium ML8_F1]|nr:MAG: hypothetical protein AVO33_03525 [delta proteobacterium ML8_F1]
MKNIVITGPIGCGKTTAIKKLIQACSLKVGGFRTVPVFEGKRRRGFVIEDYLAGSPLLDHRGTGMIGEFTDQNRLVANTAAFETQGVGIIEKALKNHAVLVFDEVGFLEREARAFQNLVMTCLEREDLLVIMALKQREGEFFLDRIRHHEKTELFTMTPDDRDEVFEDILAFCKRRYFNEKS